jgi:hypothetical protein
MENQHKVSTKYIKGIDNSAIAKGETNDCVVRALASAYDLSYDEAHQLAKTEFKRKDRKGTFDVIYNFNRIENNCVIINSKSTRCVPKNKLRYEGSSRYVKEKNPTREKIVPIVTRQLLELFPIGIYIVFVNQHVFTIIDGCIIGNPRDIKAFNGKILNLVQIV